MCPPHVAPNCAGRHERQRTPRENVAVQQCPLHAQPSIGPAPHLPGGSTHDLRSKGRQFGTPSAPGTGAVAGGRSLKPETSVGTCRPPRRQLREGGLGGRRPPNPNADQPTNLLLICPCPVGVTRCPRGGQGAWQQCSAFASLSSTFIPHNFFFGPDQGELAYPVHHMVLETTPRNQGSELSGATMILQTTVVADLTRNEE